MQFFALTFDKILIRYYLMMACVIAGVFTAQYWLVALALPVFLSAILGISFKSAQPQKTKQVKQMVATGQRMATGKQQAA
jgi:1,4-dihydroxy-2-naphthoate octaprenyltransferase